MPVSAPGCSHAALYTARSAGVVQFRDAYEAIEDPDLREASKAQYRAATAP
jgi:hypothetical protein